MTQTSVIHISTPQGLAPFLRDEVRALGMAVGSTTATGVVTEGTLTDCMRLNLHLRTAHHVLYLLKKTRCRNADDLYKEVNGIQWERLIPADGYVSVASHVVNPTIRDTRFAAMRCKDAIVDRILQRKGRRPDSGSDRSRSVVNLFWMENDCSIYVDTSGEPLSRRGYRKIPLEAPMQETLAAGVIGASGWSRRMESPFVNPMCGSGTLAIEAALMASNRAPGLTRDNFGFMHLLTFERKTWDSMRDEAFRRIIRKSGAVIVASDIEEKAIESARKNASAAGVADYIRWSACDFTETPLPSQPGTIIMNPGYGMRMGDEKELETTYRNIGNFFKKKCAGYYGYIFTANDKLAAKVGLKHKRKIAFVTGKIPCWLYEYEIYAGRGA